MSLPSNGANQMPGWVFQPLGSNLTTAETQQFLIWACGDVDTDTLDGFPDIEVLPGMTGENVRPKATRKCQ
jgi:hypothetical protein